ncbi:MAG TPA: hypothetical protein VLL08_32095 [Kineosporiaceae bacterium]|nr:hypothetical protein [Kineosporiaceae bacterium]
MAAVQSQLSMRIAAIVDEAAGDTWSHLPHRGLAERVKALVAAQCGRHFRAELDPATGLLDHAVRLAVHLLERQGSRGLFTGGDNVDSPPDTAFSINDLADALVLLRRVGVPPDNTTPDNTTLDDAGLDGATAAGAATQGALNDPSATHLSRLLEELLGAATPALVSGGVHTPNHRWEISAALARLHRLAPDPALAARVEQWLAEGVDIDDDGLYSERSALYAAAVSNPSLLAIADTFDRPDLIAAVELNLSATVDLLLPDGSVETVLSRRQDQTRPFPLAGYLLPLRRLALLRGRGDLSWAAGLALTQGIVAPADAATQLLLQPEMAHQLPAAEAPKRPRRRLFGAAGLLMDHQESATAVVFGGSDHARHRPIRSGLANSPTFLRLIAGSAVLDSARLTRTFFGLGPFRSNGLQVEDAAEATTVTLTETVSAAYYQPLSPADHEVQGRYALGDEGRFSAAMSFDQRAQDEITLTTAVRVELTPTGAEVLVDVTGPAVDWALEFAFRCGGTFSGARSLGERKWQLDPIRSTDGAPAASYRIGSDVISIAILEASAGNGEPLSLAHAAPRYEPGEEYGFLGGTDAATGELLYLSGRSPASVRLRLTAESNPHSSRPDT